MYQYQLFGRVVVRRCWVIFRTVFVLCAKICRNESIKSSRNGIIMSLDKSELRIIL